MVAAATRIQRRRAHNVSDKENQRLWSSARKKRVRGGETDLKKYFLLSVALKLTLRLLCCRKSL